MFHSLRVRVQRLPYVQPLQALRFVINSKTPAITTKAPICNQRRSESIAIENCEGREISVGGKSNKAASAEWSCGTFDERRKWYPAGRICFVKRVSRGGWKIKFHGGNKIMTVRRAVAPTRIFFCVSFTVKLIWVPPFCESATVSSYRAKVSQPTSFFHAIRFRRKIIIHRTVITHTPYERVPRSIRV